MVLETTGILPSDFMLCMTVPSRGMSDEPELFYYWHYYYQIRSLTLWDWEKNAPIDADFEELVRN